MSINSLFEISQRSFRALNAKMNATGQNVANADSEGYHRRRATLQASNTVSSGIYTSPAQNNTPGDGASLDSFERVRDRMLDQAAAEAQTGEKGAREEARLLSVLEGALATDTEGSLTSSLESFFGGLNDLANNPTDQGVRETVLAKADALTGAFDRLDQKIGGLESDTESALASSVDKANGLIEEVAGLNKKISEARASGTPDLAAKDRRDSLVKKLSGLMPVDVQEDSNGYTLSVNGMNVVQGTETTQLRAKNLESPSAPTVEFGDTGVAFEPGSENAGEIGAQLRTLNQTLPEVQNQLDSLANDVVTQVNSIHENGFDQNGNTGDPFFDPTGTTAGSLQRAVSAPEEIAAYGAAGEPGNTTPAQNMAALSDSLTPKAIDLSANVGSKVQQAAAREEAKAATADHLESMAKGVSGVSVDEEMSTLIEQQQQFAASARVLRTAQEVTNTLLSM
ncbi:MAG: flagellar hook-associated protein FlgK [Salinibacter sp.]